MGTSRRKQVREVNPVFVSLGESEGDRVPPQRIRHWQEEDSLFALLFLKRARDIQWR